MRVLETPSFDRGVSLFFLKSRRSLLFGALAGLAFALAPLGGAGWMDVQVALAQSEEELSQPSELPPDDTPDTAASTEGAEDPQPLEPGEAVVTRFPHTIDGTDAKGDPVKLIDTAGTSVSIVDIRNPSSAPIGEHWIDEPQRMFVTAADVGQVFGVAIAQRPDNDTPAIFVSATAAYGLHRLDGDWMPGMWGTDGGPGTIYKLDPANGYKPEKFADVLLEGRENTGASLGNIAYDKAHDRLFVSDLETGMIHSLDAASGQDMGTFDHGNDGRASFLDVWTQQQQSLDPVAFDPKSQARVKECADKFTRDPSCWNLADFRRRVWGLKVRTDGSGGVRLYYSVWGSDAFGNPDWPEAGDDRRNAVWSVAITSEGLFDTASVRREFFMPGFFPAMPRFGDKAGNSNPVADITFPECTAQNLMLVAERGSMRNLGLDEVEPFARPYESRVVRYELGQDDMWRPKGRYDVGFHDRNGNEGEPFMFANAAGGVDFGYKFDANGVADMSTPSQSVWMTGDGLCSPKGPCNDTTKGVGTDQSEVHGLQGSPADGFLPMEDAVQTASAEQSALFRSYMIDTDINIDGDGKPIAEALSRNDATKIGDVAIYQVCKVADPLPAVDVPPEGDIVTVDTPPVAEPPDDWPVHTLKISHNKWASNTHRVKQSWHYRKGSWHKYKRSWHWKEGSWHTYKRSWHWRDGSWHKEKRSWHWRNGSWHKERRSWHWRDGSWHKEKRSWHRREGSWHTLKRSWHKTKRSWGKPEHLRWPSRQKPEHLRNPSRKKHVNIHARWESRKVTVHKKPRNDKWVNRGKIKKKHVNRHSAWDSRQVKRKKAHVNRHARWESRGITRKKQHVNRHTNWDNRRVHRRQRADDGNNHMRQRQKFRQRENFNNHNGRRHGRRLSQMQGG
jgi:hypothetical protein